MGWGVHPPSACWSIPPRGLPDLHQHVPKRDLGGERSQIDVQVRFIYQSVIYIVVFKCLWYISLRSFETYLCGKALREARDLGDMLQKQIDANILTFKVMCHLQCFSDVSSPKKHIDATIY